MSAPNVLETSGKRLRVVRLETNDCERQLIYIATLSSHLDASDNGIFSEPFKRLFGVGLSASEHLRKHLLTLQQPQPRTDPVTSFLSKCVAPPTLALWRYRTIICSRFTP